MTQPAVRGIFDLVVCAFNTLQVLESEAKVLATFEAARALLGDTGRLVIDLSNPSCDDDRELSPEDRRDRIVRAFIDTHGRPLEIRERSIDDAAGASVDLDWRIIDRSSASPEPRARFVLRLYHYAPATIESLLRTAGLHIRERYGDVLRSPFDARRSRKQVVVCSR
jgi:hypothetical protein